MLDVNLKTCEMIPSFFKILLEHTSKKKSPKATALEQWFSALMYVRIPWETCKSSRFPGLTPREPYSVHLENVWFKPAEFS